MVKAAVRKPMRSIIRAKRLAEPFPFCSCWAMERAILANIILASPAWARVGLTMRDLNMRERAADTLAATIIERLEPGEQPDHRQMALPL